MTNEFIDPVSTLRRFNYHPEPARHDRDWMVSSRNRAAARSAAPSLSGAFALPLLRLEKIASAVRGNVTDKVAALCNGKQSCSLPGSQVNNPDPAFGCNKSFKGEWRCGETPDAVPAVPFETTIPTLHSGRLCLFLGTSATSGHVRDGSEMRPITDISFGIRIVA